MSTRRDDANWNNGFWWGVATTLVLVLLAWTYLEFAIGEP